MASSPRFDARDAAPSEDNLANYSLTALVADHEVSVRLRNSINGAAASGELPYRTVGEYLTAGAEAEAVMLRRVLNFGRKTGRELAALIASLGAEPPMSAVLANDRLVHEECETVLRVLAAHTIRELAECEILSARLTGLLAQPRFGDRTLADVLADLGNVEAEMLRTPNCGRKSVREFRAFCARNAVRSLGEAGLSDGEARVARLMSGPQVSAKVVTLPSGVVPSLPAVPDHATLAERLEWMLSQLDPPRREEVLRRRCGIGPFEKATLEDVGVVFGVTRERIRQVERDALRALRVKSRRAPLRPFLVEEADGHFKLLTSGSLSFRLRELHERSPRLNPYLRLALKIENLGVHAWLDLVAHRFSHGWLAPKVDPQQVERAVVLLDDMSELPIPFPVAGLVPSDQLQEAQLAAAVIADLSMLDGYLMPRRIGTRASRLVRLHAILATVGAKLSGEQLLGRYQACFPHDLCTERDAEIVMSAAPHLFLEIDDGAWAAIGRAGTVMPSSAAPAVVRSSSEEPGTIAHALQKALDARGPTRLSDLMDEAGEILPEGRSVNSIGPVLLMNPDLFVRVLPGVYGLREQVAPLLTSMPQDWPVLFNDSQARMYALARYAGEPRSIFPFWTAATERALCCWARHSGGEKIFTSLLAIANIDEWPLGEEERLEWLQLKRHHARFELGSSLRHWAAYELPEFDRVFAACHYVAAHGTFNYCAANRLTGRKLDSHCAVGLVAILLRLGVIEETARDGFRWQRTHRATGCVAALIAEFDTAFARARETPDWNSALGAKLAAQIAAPWDHDTWVDDVALAAMFSGTATALDVEDDEEDDPLARLMAQHRRAREHARREATLDWLLTQ